ncbi:hypothetical protein [Variovorax guangxiensis]|uniref:hypothetical protein n=1 Tax=Variovorax guangxiensis TaxID=1775474 RepID=UPI002854ED4C|nr:hypothetical protein [Variovorax guangxiensis]MDR6857236.1 hypothetical protein [Variovorax guangxiensis]
MVNATLKARLRALEAAAGEGAWEVMEIDAVPNAQQLREIADAEQTGKRIMVFVARGDTAWLTGSGIRPPWLLPEGAAIDVNQFV